MDFHVCCLKNLFHSELIFVSSWEFQETKCPESHRKNIGMNLDTIPLQLELHSLSLVHFGGHYFHELHDHKSY